MINPHIFRAYDIRGVVGRDIDPDAFRRIAQAFGSMLRAEGYPEAIVGRDNRLSSPDLARAVTEGLASTGVDVVDIGQVTTPCFYYGGMRMVRPAGVMVTGSHNPADQNGMKLLKGPSTIFGEEITSVARLAEGGPLLSGAGRVRQEDVVPEYQAAIMERIRLGPRHLAAVVDCGNGAAGPVNVPVLERLGVEVTPLYAEPDGRYPHHHPDPVEPENLRDLIATVKRQGADLGLAFDGDGDRLGAVDERGRILWGDALMALFWREILPQHPGATAIIEIKCSQSLVDEVERLGGKPLFYKTGHSLIKAKMREVGALFAGEMSGHLFFADEYFGFDDGLYAAARLLRIVSHLDRPLSSLVDQLPRYESTPEIRVECPDARKDEVVASAARELMRAYPCLTVDGVRVMTPGGWGLIRASNTQPVLVVRAEGKTARDLAEVQGLLDRALETAGAGPVRWPDHVPAGGGASA